MLIKRVFRRFPVYRPANLQAGVLVLCMVLGAIVLLAASPARAEGTVRVVDQFGIGSLLLKVVKDQKLIQKAGAKEGIAIDVQWTKVSGGAAANETLLSGAADVGTVGIGPLLTIWDRTYAHQQFRALAALGSVPVYLLTNNPKIHSIADFTRDDRIAVVAAIVSEQGRILQMASAKAFGDANYTRLDAQEVSLPHADATVALLSGKALITAHFSNVPYEFQELADPRIHKVLSAADVLGGPATTSAVAASARWRRDNPKTYQAVKAALLEAEHLVQADKAAAAVIYIRQDQSKLSPAFVENILRNKEVDFTVTPQNTLPLGTFLHKVGVLKHEPKSWRDYFFDDEPTATGS